MNYTNRQTDKCAERVLNAVFPKIKKSHNSVNYRTSTLFSFLHCGKEGIRTPGTVLPYIRFPSVPLKPLEHLSSVILRLQRYKIFLDLQNTVFIICGLYFIVIRNSFIECPNIIKWNMRRNITSG